MAQVKKSGKKAFFDVAVPLTSSKIALYGESVEALDGKVVRLDLTRNLRGKSLELRFKVKLVDGKLIGEPIAVELIGSYVRRMMRGGVDYVEDSFKVTCKDENVTVKPFMITRNRVSRAVRNALRIEARKHLEAYLKTRTAIEVFSDITANKIQRELSFELKKIYPLALCEIRIFELIREAKLASA